MADEQSGGVYIGGNVGDVSGQIAGGDINMEIHTNAVSGYSANQIKGAFEKARAATSDTHADSLLRSLEGAVTSLDQPQANRLQETLWNLAPRAMEVLLMTLPTIFKMAVGS